MYIKLRRREEPSWGSTKGPERRGAAGDVPRDVFWSDEDLCD